MKPGNLVLLPLLAILFAGVIVFAARYVSGPRMELQSATVLPEPIALPDFLLADQDETPFTRNSLRNRVSLLFFGFTNCPDICPATLQQLAVVSRKLAETGADTPTIVLVSVDPARDTAEVLKQYVGYFGEGLSGVTGDIDEIRALTSRLGIYFEYAEGEGDNYNVNHSAVIIAINEDAEFFALFSAPHDIDAMVNDVQILMAIQ